MDNAKHIGGIAAVAVALGMGMAVANTPAVALAAPDNSGSGSSSDTPSEKTAASATNGPASRHPRAPKPSGAVNRGPATTGAATTPAAVDVPGTNARRSDRVTSQPALGNTSAKTGPNTLVDDVPATDATARPSRLDAVRVVPAERRPSFAPVTESAAPIPVAAIAAAPTSSSAAPAVSVPTPASTVITPTPADPMSRLVSTVINAVLSPFASSAPTAPVQSPAEWTLLAFARREFEPITTGFVGGTSEVTSSAVDPGFISSTHNFGLFSVTSAADPDDNNFVAFVFESPVFTFVLTSGADPEDNLGFGAASTGVAGHTVGTFISPFLNFSVAIPIEDPFAELFTELVRLGF